MWRTGRCRTRCPRGAAADGGGRRRAGGAGEPREAARRRRRRRRRARASQVVERGVAPDWLDSVVAALELEPVAAARAAGVAQQMHEGGYSAEQTRAILEGLLYGTHGRLRAAWDVFVLPTKDTISRTAFRRVLGLRTGGAGLTSAEAARLFALFDEDSSGSLDFDEFCRVMRAMPLQQPLEQTALGAWIAVMSSVSRAPDMSAKLTKQQLAKAGRTIMRMQQVLDNDQQQGSRRHLCSQEHARRDAIGGVPRGGCSAASAYGHDALDGPQFAKLFPLLGEDLPPAHVARLFEKDVDCPGHRVLRVQRAIRHLNLRRAAAVAGGAPHRPRSPRREGARARTRSSSTTARRRRARAAASPARRNSTCAMRASPTSSRSPCSAQSFLPTARRRRSATTRRAARAVFGGGAAGTPPHRRPPPVRLTPLSPPRRLSLPPAARSPPTAAARPRDPHPHTPRFPRQRARCRRPATPETARGGGRPLQGVGASAARLAAGERRRAGARLAVRPRAEEGGV